MPGGQAAIEAVFPDLQARLDALLDFNPSTGSLSANLALAGQILANVQLMASIGIEPPSLSAQIAAVAAIVADLSARLEIALVFSDALGVAGLHSYRYSGEAGDLGSEFNVELAAGFPGGAASDHTEGILLATTVPGCWSALAQIMKVTP